MMSDRDKRNCNIDYLKMLCAVLVVFLHVRVGYADLGFYFEPITRVAVPCFFMISGYLIFNRDAKVMNDRVLRSFRKVLVIFLWSTLVYFLWKLLHKVTFGDWAIQADLTPINLLLLNEHPYSSVLWYLTAYLYVLLIVWALNKTIGWRVLKFVVPMLIVYNIIFGKWSLIVIGCDPDTLWTRNFFACGIPFFVA